MKSKILTTMLSCAALAALSATASAAVMTYTQTGFLSGSLGGTSFTDAAVTLRVTADTANAQYVPFVGGLIPVWTNAGVTTIDIDGFDTATFVGTYGVQAADYTAFFTGNVVGFTNLSNNFGIVYFNQSDDLQYNLATEATFTGALLNDEVSGSNPGPYSTTLGELVLTGASGSSTFTAAVATVPEPSAFALLGLGAVGLVARRRRSA